MKVKSAQEAANRGFDAAMAGRPRQVYYQYGYDLPEEIDPQKKGAEK